MIRRSQRRNPDDPLVELRGLSKRFVLQTEKRRSIQESFVNMWERKQEHGHAFWSLRDVSLCIRPGDTLGIIGPNGSGKSTLLKLITGILEPTDGDIIVNGRVSALLELGAGFHGDLTGRENIYLNGSIVGLSQKEMRQQTQSIIDFAELGEFIDVPVRHYSSGMYVRLGFAVAVHCQPDLLIVDEVLAVGDVSFQHKCLDSIQKFRRRGGTLLLVSHDLGTIQSLCSRAVWLEQGRIMAEGVPTDVVMSYLNAVARREEVAANQEPLPQTDRGQRWGTGRIQVTSLEMLDGSGNPCTIFVDGGTMEIRMRYYAPERINRPIFGLALHNATGVHISGPNTLFGRCYVPYVEGQGTVTFRIPSLALLEGTYLWSTAVIDEADTEMFDYNDRAYQFRVYPGSSNERYGLMTLRGAWEFAPDEEGGRRQDAEEIAPVELRRGIQAAKSDR